jgi:hypothetical protein
VAVYLHRVRGPRRKLARVRPRWRRPGLGGELRLDLGALCAAAGTGQALRRGRPLERRAWALLLAAAVVWLIGELLFLPLVADLIPRVAERR